MALFKPFKGNRASLDAQPLHDGYAYFCTDDGSFHIDYVDADGNLQRKQINAKYAEALTNYSIATILNDSDVEIPTSKAVMAAMDNLTADDLGIYVQDTEPTNAVAGDIWVDTANDPSIMDHPVTSVNGQVGDVVIDIPSKTSELTNDSGYITSVPVQSVNGQTGDVILSVLPDITTADNGKVLMVVDGAWQLVSLNLSVDADGVVSM